MSLSPDISKHYFNTYLRISHNMVYNIDIMYFKIFYKFNILRVNVHTMIYHNYTYILHDIT